MTLAPRTAAPPSTRGRWFRARRFAVAAPSAAVLVAGLVAGAASAPRRLHDAPSTLPADSLKPGASAIGYSVFQGARVDTFSLTILGVLKGNSPGGDLILARAHGAYLEHTGIIAGMSGSPIYVGGKLIGALAFAFPFATEPIAGITPIREMLRDLSDPAPRGGPGDESRFGWLDGPPSGGASTIGGPPSGAQPIATPVAFAGFSPQTLHYLEPWLKERALVASPGGGTTPGGSCDSIAPGSAVGVQLVRGDWSATAIGTVTYRDGDRVLAFGHPFFAMGRVQLPMTAATIHTVIPNQQVSSKVGAPTVTCGTLVVDRSSGIAGDVGRAPPMLPVRVSVAGPGGRAQRYRFEVARSRFLTPGLVGATIVNSISGALFDVGPSTARYTATYHLNGGARSLKRSDALLVPGPLAGAGDDAVQTLSALLVNRFEATRLDSVAVEVSIEEGLDDTALTGIRVSPSIVAPGETVEVELILQPARHATETRRVSLRVPPQVPPGELTVRVCDGPETDRWERDRAPDRYAPQSFDHLLSILGEKRRGDRLYVQLYRQSQGATVGGGEISQAPPSVLDVLGAGPKAGEAAPTKGATLEEIAVPFDRPARGSESMTLTILPYRAR